jgi:hypothetical protein
MVLQTYVDDSEAPALEDGRPVLVLAGYIGRAEKWAELVDQWTEELGHDPPLRRFKMKEAASLHGEFCGFSREQRDARLGSWPLKPHWLAFTLRFLWMITTHTLKIVWTGGVGRPISCSSMQSLLSFGSGWRQRDIWKKSSFILTNNLGRAI